MAKERGPAPSAGKAPSKRSPRMVPRKPAKGAPPQTGLKLADDAVAAEITRLLRDALTPSTLFLKNLSDAHKRHKEAHKHGGGHYSLYVVSDLFTGLKPIQRQQWIYKLLDALIQQKKIHALEMKLVDSDEALTIGS